MLESFNPNSSHFDPSLTAVAGIALLSFLWTLILSLRFRALGRRYKTLLSSVNGMDLESTLSECLMTANEAKEISSRSAEKTDRLEAIQKNCIQRSGVVRYDAFDDVSGRMSFSLVLTDQAGNGLTVTSLYGRESCRIYAKSLREGVSEIPLSDEEREAIRLALSDSPRP